MTSRHDASEPSHLHVHTHADGIEHAHQHDHADHDHDHDHHIHDTDDGDVHSHEHDTIEHARPATKTTNGTTCGFGRSRQNALDALAAGP